MAAILTLQDKGATQKLIAKKVIYQLPEDRVPRNRTKNYLNRTVEGLDTIEEI